MSINIYTGTIPAPRLPFSPKIFLIDKKADTEAFKDENDKYYKLINLNDLRNKRSVEADSNQSDTAGNIIKYIKTFSNIEFMYYSRLENKNDSDDSKKTYHYLINDLMKNQIPYDAYFFIFSSALYYTKYIQNNFFDNEYYTDKDENIGTADYKGIIKKIADLNKVSIIRTGILPESVNTNIFYADGTGDSDKDSEEEDPDSTTDPKAKLKLKIPSIKKSYQSRGCAIIYDENVETDPSNTENYFPDVGIICNKLNFYSNVDTLPSVFSSWTFLPIKPNGDPDSLVIDTFVNNKTQLEDLDKANIIHFVNETGYTYLNQSYSTLSSDGKHSFINNTMKKAFIEQRVKDKLVQFFVEGTSSGKIFLMQSDTIGNQVGFREINNYLYTIMDLFASYGLIARANTERHPDINPSGPFAYEIEEYDPRDLARQGGDNTNTYKANIKYLTSDNIEFVIINIIEQLKN